MDLRKLKKLIDLVQESGITELEVTEGEEKVRIVKQTFNSQQNQTFLGNGHSSFAPHSQALSAPPVAAEVAEEPAGHVVKAPMVGTFYRSSSPGAASFVDIGQAVKEGDRFGPIGGEWYGRLCRLGPWEVDAVISQGSGAAVVRGCIGHWIR